MTSSGLARTSVRWWGRPTTTAQVVVDAAAAAIVLFVAWYGFGGGDVDGIVGAVGVFVPATTFGIRKTRRNGRG